MGITKIQWTDATWNPVRGCSLVSAGCTNCYAMKQAHRFSGPGQPYKELTRLAERGPIWTGKVRLVPEVLDQPLRWKKPRRVFVNSMSDLFHEGIPIEFIFAALTVIALTPRHSYQILTKRPARMQSIFDDVEHQTSKGRWFSDFTTTEYLWARGYLYKPASRSRAPLDFSHPHRWPLPNLWLGVSCEDQKTAGERIPLLLQTPAAVRFVSVEPLLEPINVDPYLWFNPAIQWLICGGESGPHARPCNIEWIRDIARRCKAARVPCFVKQLGSNAHHAACSGPCCAAACYPPRRAIHQMPPCRLPLDHPKGGDPAEWPMDLRVREFPANA